MKLPVQAAPVYRNFTQQNKAKSSAVQPSIFADPAECMRCVTDAIRAGNSPSQALRGCRRLGACLPI